MLDVNRWLGLCIVSTLVGLLGLACPHSDGHGPIVGDGGSAEQIDAWPEPPAEEPSLLDAGTGFDACVPSCTGRECGDDGCGDSCGTCSESMECATASGRCVAACVPATESCNGKDDDCDGSVDEGCACTNGQSWDCGSDTGVCKKGVQVCAQGSWGICSGGVQPTAEVCNGKDDDCDGSVDEGLATESEICCQGTRLSLRGAGAPLVRQAACNSLVYGRYAARGQTSAVNVLPDFSFAGYRGGGVAIPSAPVRQTLSPSAGDNRARIQAAIDAVGALSPDANGLRGAVLLKKGTYEVGNTLRIRKSGVVLRGEGQGTSGTVLVASWSAPTDQQSAHDRPLIAIQGSGSGLGEVSGTRVSILDAHVPVGARSFQVASAAGFAVGDRIAVRRQPNQTWIDALKMGPYGWTPAIYTIAHERSVVKIEGTRLTIDIPIVDAIGAPYSEGAVFKTNVTGRLQRCGVEDLRLDSVYSSSTDENHAWTAVLLSRTEDSWVRRVTVRHFAYEAVGISNQSNFNTVEEVAMVDLVSEIRGGRRYPFQVSDGVGNLVQRCYARSGRHNFVSGSRVTGPNVWLDCFGTTNHADDGPHHRWATGLLFDNVKTSSLRVQNRKTSGTGHGWAGAQVLFWNSVASDIICDAPLGAMNWTIGCKGTKTEGSYAPEEPYGWWESHGTRVSPRSLYLAQLAARKGQAAVDKVTTAPQRAGTIWHILEAWAGQGSLERYGPDPTCKYGILSGNACCAASCGTCGGAGCSQQPGGSAACCTSVITTSGKSCAVYPAPCVMPDPTCKYGILSGKACCAASCGTCGGTGCGQQPGGSAACCTGIITTSGKSCAVYPAPCVMP